MGLLGVLLALMVELGSGCLVPPVQYDKLEGGETRVLGFF